MRGIDLEASGDVHGEVHSACAAPSRNAEFRGSFAEHINRRTSCSRWACVHP